MNSCHAVATWICLFLSWIIRDLWCISLPSYSTNQPVCHHIWCLFYLYEVFLLEFPLLMSPPHTPIYSVSLFFFFFQYHSDSGSYYFLMQFLFWLPYIVQHTIQYYRCLLQGEIIDKINVCFELFILQNSC